jgi:LPXTG-motif cell wall-anchored protein
MISSNFPAFIISLIARKYSVYAALKAAEHTLIIENLGTLTVLYPGDQGGDTTPVVTPVKPTTPVGQVLGATRLPDVPAPAAPAPAKDGSVLGAMRNVVQTGDSSMMVTWGAIFAAAVAVLAVWLRKRNKKA